MRSLPTPWIILALILASALFLQIDSPAFAQPATVYPASGVAVPFRGLRNIGVTLTASIDASQTTNIFISNPARLKVGQIVETQDASKEIMEITGLGGSTMNVNRGVLGTSPAAHDSGTALYSDFTAVKVMVSGAGYRDTGATLSAALDASTLENSGAFLAQSIGTSETTINVTDASLLTDATVARIDGTAFVSVNDYGWLGSTGRAVTCPWNTLSGDNIMFSCSTLGWEPDGPEGSGILAVVRLRAERLGPVSLSLEDAMLLDWQAHPLTAEVVPNASVTVVSGSPSPPPPPAPDCGGSGTKMCILPSTQQVGLGNEFSAYIVAQNVVKQYGLGLGAYQFRLRWSPATEEMTVLSVHRGYRRDDGQGWYRNAGLSADVDETTTEIPLTQVGQLQPGWTTLMKNSNEEMLILAVSAGPPASMTVVRGYRGTTPTTHSAGDWIWAGPERMNVTRSLPAPHNGGVDFRADLRVLRVSDQGLLSASALKIDDEWFKVIEMPARTLRETGLTLSSAVDEATTTLPVSGSGPVQKGWIIQIDNEVMPVTGVGSGTISVVRGYYGSQAASHSAGAALKSAYSESNTVRAVRGFQGSTVASHSAGAPITDVDGLGGYAFTMSSPAVPAVIDFVWASDSTFLGQTGRTPQCNPPTFPGGDVSFQCTTTGALPLGATGSGTLANVNVTGHQVLAGAPVQTINLSGVALHDVSGDALPAGTAAGSVRVVGCPDFDDNRSVTFTGDIIAIARAVLINGDPDPYPTEPEMDLDENGAVTFTGDVLIAAQVAQASQPQPLRCPPVDVN